MISYGFVGLGQMGAPMAGRLAGAPITEQPAGAPITERPAGGNLIVYDTRPAAMAPLVEAGATAAGSLAEVASADLISVMVRDDAQVNEVTTALLAAAAPGTVIAIHSTIRAETAIRLADMASGQGVSIVDAPVSGGVIGASAGTLAVMVGGTEAAFAEVKGPFGAWADLVLHVGPVGAGTRAKLARNLLHFVAFTAGAEAQRLAEAAGVSLNKLGRLVRHSDAVTGGPGAIMIRRTTAALVPQDPLYPIMCHVRALGEKDLSLALELADELGVEAPLARLAYERFAAGLGLAPESAS